MNNLRSTSPGVERNGYCDHTSARQIRVYMSYADANTIRLRAAQASGSPAAHVSWLYEIPGGWAWTVCPECRNLSEMGGRATRPPSPPTLGPTRQSRAGPRRRAA